MAAEYAHPSALAHYDAADLLDALATGIVVLDAQLCPVYANVAAQDLLAFSLKAARGRPFPELLSEANGLARILKRALETGESIADRELTVRPARRAKPARSTSPSRRLPLSPARSCCSSSPTPRSASGSRARTTCWRGS